MAKKKIESTRHATFHRAYLLTKGSVDKSVEVDWSSVCQRVQDAGLSLRAEDGTIFAATIDAHPLQISMHKPLSPDFLSIINESGAGIADALDALQEDGRLLAHSTAVAFMQNSPNCFAIVKGSKPSPGVPSLMELLTRLFPQKPGSHWKIDPVIAPGDIDRLRSAEGISAVSGTLVSGDGSLFGGPQLLEMGLASELQSAATYVGAEVELTFKLQLKRENRSKERVAKFRDFALKLLPGLDTNRPSSAKAVDSDQEVELQLSPHQLSAQFLVLEADTGVTQFSVLQDEIARVRGMMEDRVFQLIQG